MGAAGASPPRSPAAAARRRPIWTDPWAVALAIATVVVNAGFSLYLWQRFDTFPELIALHFNPYGEADLIGSKSEIFKLPLIGAIVGGMNGALAIVASWHDRVLSRTVLGVALLVQALLCAGAWRILA